MPLIEARPIPTSVLPAKAGTQIHPERLVGFTWAPAFAGETENEAGDSKAKIARYGNSRVVPQPSPTRS
jgi:carbamate kinase